MTKTRNEGSHSANPLYGVDQLRRALDALGRASTEEAISNAEARTRKWGDVLSGMADGTLSIGTRTPVSGTPAWVTLEIAQGGFATGKFVAEGPLLPHEVKLLEHLSDGSEGTHRERLNLYFLTDEGLETLQSALRSGQYQIDIAEEGALLVVAWLLSNGHERLAFEILSEIRPWMHRLRFYPKLTDTAVPKADGVHVRTVREVRRELLNKKPSKRVAAMNKTLAVWNPLYDELVALWLETVSGPAPHMRVTDGQLARHPNGNLVPDGGLPDVTPDGWQERKSAFIERYEAAVKAHGKSGRHHQKKSNFQCLYRQLLAATDPSELTEHARRAVRFQLASALRRHGIPSEATHRERRRQQANIAARPLHSEVAWALATRMEHLVPNGGLADVVSLAAPVAETELRSRARSTQGSTSRKPSEDTASIEPTFAVPSQLLRKLESAEVAPVATLVERGVIPSAEVLARVVPQITGRVIAENLSDPICRGLYEALYRAFRSRRSLLLFDYAKQVSINELPWTSALLKSQRQGQTTTPSSSSSARQSLRNVALLTLEHFPANIIPNKMRRELTTLAKSANVAMPLVEEIAADIFMGDFTPKFRDAAVIATESMQGTLYARYYDLPRKLPGESTQNTTKRTQDRYMPRQLCPNFTSMCKGRALEAVSDPKARSVTARNGTILEQMHILTTFNLATLVFALDLETEIEARGEKLGQDALTVGMSRLLRTFTSLEQLYSTEDIQNYGFAFQVRLRAIKNAAYAFRQAVFFLSFVEAEAQKAAIKNAEAALYATFDARLVGVLQPVLGGLAKVIDGAEFSDDGVIAGRGNARRFRRFLGWSVGPHWLMPKARPV